MWFPLALQSVKGSEGEFFFSFPAALCIHPSSCHTTACFPLAVTQQRLCRQPTQPGWKNPKADCCVNISHQGNIKCSVIFIHGIVWVILCLCYQAIFDMSAVRWAWAGQVVLAGRSHREQRVERCCSFRWGLQLFPHLSKAGFRLWAGCPRRKYWVSSGLQDLKAGNWTSWADQALLKSEKWQCWEEWGRLKASVGICRRRGQDEVAALSVQAPWQRVHAHSPATLIKLSIRHSEWREGVKPSLCTKERQDQVM